MVQFDQHAIILTWPLAPHLTTELESLQKCNQIGLLLLAQRREMMEILEERVIEVHHIFEGFRHSVVEKRWMRREPPQHRYREAADIDPFARDERAAGIVYLHDLSRDRVPQRIDRQ